MKTRVLCYGLALFACSSFFVACKKGVDEQPPEQKPLTLSSKDMQGVSAATKVWHGERVQGVSPSPKGTALKLNATLPVTKAFAGRYVIINPEIAQGDVAGYYVQFSGAKEYFKVDYSKPRGARMARGAKPVGPFSFKTGQTRLQNGNEDSAIVVALPANLTVPDTLCMSYAAWDTQGNISNVVTTCVIVNSVGTTTDGTYLHGEWRLTASWDTTYRDTVYYNRWIEDRTSSGYICDYDSAANTYQLIRNFLWITPIVTDSLYRLKYNYTFAANGGLKGEHVAKVKFPNMTASTCIQFVFDPVEDFTDGMTGAWNFDAATGKMILIAEFDDAGLPSLEAWEYRVTKVNNNNIVLEESLWGTPFYYRLEK
jgi:hypothetical protein